VTLSGFTPDLSQPICYDNAFRIAQLVRTSAEINCVENMSPTMLDSMFVAAMVLIRRSLESDRQDRWLDKDSSVSHCPVRGAGSHSGAFSHVLPHQAPCLSRRPEHLDGLTSSIWKGGRKPGRRRIGAIGGCIAGT